MMDLCSLSVKISSRNCHNWIWPLLPVRLPWWPASTPNCDIMPAAKLLKMLNSKRCEGKNSNAVPTQWFDGLHRLQSVRFLLLFDLGNILVGATFKVRFALDGHHFAFAQQLQVRPERVAGIVGDLLLKFYSKKGNGFFGALMKCFFFFGSDLPASIRTAFGHWCTNLGVWFLSVEIEFD